MVNAKKQARRKRAVERWKKQIALYEELSAQSEELRKKLTESLEKARVILANTQANL